MVVRRVSKGARSRGLLPNIFSCTLIYAATQLAACSDEKNGEQTKPDTSSPSDVSQAILSVDSTTACLIDADCVADRHCFHGACVWECNDEHACDAEQVCGPRARCEDPKQKQMGSSGGDSPPEVVAGVSIVSTLPEIIRVQPGQRTAKIAFKTSRSVPGGVVRYTVERYAFKHQKPTLPFQVQRAVGQDAFEVEVPTADSDPAFPDASLQEVQVVTSVGTFRVKLQPRPGAGGQYAGRVKVPRFGEVGLPLDFEIVTTPAHASLADAEKVELLLPIRGSSIFSPRAFGQDAPPAAKVALSFQSFSEEWVGTVRTPFEFPAESLLGRYAGGAVVRGLRFAFKEQDGVLRGTLRDSWEGLYDARTADGVASPATVVFEGRLEASRVAAVEIGTGATLPGPSEAIAAQPALDVAAVCEADMFSVAPLTVGGVDVDCENITSAIDFELASIGGKARCAVAVAETALRSENTTAALISAFLQGDTDVTGGESFASFMARCAAGTDGTCQASPEVLCGRALTAASVVSQEAPDAHFAAVFDAYTRTTREAFLGRQLAAYQADADTRLEWLKSQNYPAVVTAAVRDLNKQLLQTWQTRVLKAHLDSLGGQYDATGLSVLARQVQGANLVDQRQLLLLEMSQSWRGAMEALTVATRRWNDVHNDLVSRTLAADYVAQKAFDLYVLGGVVDQLNVSAGAGFASDGLASGFASLLSELRRLAQPFSALVYDRDAEVVVSRSLNPLRTNDSLLGDIQASAQRELERASTAVLGILERAQRQAVDEQLLRDDLTNQIDTLFDELVTLCGLPLGCQTADRQKAECWPLVAAGECGFGTQVRNTGTVASPTLEVEVVDYAPQGNVSEAGEAILDVKKALDAVSDSKLALAEYSQATKAMLATNDAQFAELDRLEEQEAALSEKIAQSSEALAALDDARFARLERFHDELKLARADALTERQARLAQMLKLREDGTEESIGYLRASSALSLTASSMKEAIERMEKITEFAADGFPQGLDDFSAPARMSVYMTQIGVTAGMHVLAQGLEVTASALATEREVKAMVLEDDLAKADFRDQVEVAKHENELAEIEAEFERDLTQNERAMAELEEAIADAKEVMQWERVVARDMNALLNRRDDILTRVAGEADRNTEIHQLDYTVKQRQLSYLRVVQRAQLLEGRLRNLVTQRERLNQNLGSPSVVFGWANQLEQAESRLERAKAKMMDWVVALEYLAVRPFMDVRQQILLARNTYQLEEIAHAIEAIQDRCGGAINSNTSEISLREDIFSFENAVKDTATDEVLSPSQIFRDFLARGSIPVDARVRFTADASVGDLLKRNGLLAASFELGLEEFANLASSCNAKIEDIAIQLVGENLGRAQPTVALAYDGSSTVRSCQPNIEQIVSSIGRDATAFSAITLFRTPGRVLAPTAGINEFGEVNQTLVGLPLASRYTVIIDPTLGENSKINWDNVEDIRIKVRYAYQDLYPEGQCY